MKKRQQIELGHLSKFVTSITDQTDLATPAHRRAFDQMCALVASNGKAGKHQLIHIYKRSSVPKQRSTVIALLVGEYELFVSTFIKNALEVEQDDRVLTSLLLYFASQAQQYSDNIMHIAYQEALSVMWNFGGNDPHRAKLALTAMKMFDLHYGGGSIFEGVL